MKKLLLATSILTLSIQASALSINTQTVKKVCKHRKEQLKKGLNVDPSNNVYLFELDLSGQISLLNMSANIFQTVNCKSKKTKLVYETSYTKDSIINKKCDYPIREEDRSNHFNKLTAYYKCADSMIKKDSSLLVKYTKTLSRDEVKLDDHGNLVININKPKLAVSPYAADTRNPEITKRGLDGIMFKAKKLSVIIKKSEMKYYPAMDWGGNEYEGQDHQASFKVDPYQFMKQSLDNLKKQVEETLTDVDISGLNQIDQYDAEEFNNPELEKIPLDSYSVVTPTVFTSGKKHPLYEQEQDEELNIYVSSRKISINSLFDFITK